MVPRNPALVKEEEQPTLTVGESIERLIGRLLLAGSLTMAAPIMVGCTNEMVPASQSSAVIGGGQSDWAQQQGRRDTAQVSYMGSYWQQNSECGYRFGCQAIDVVVKIKVKPAPGANFDYKRVGIVYHDVYDGTQNALGSYFTTFADGYEEWHVPFTVRSWDPGAVTFDAWYEDGVGNTFFDDNGGALHAIGVQGARSIVQQISGTNLTVGEVGVYGHIAVRVADLAWDKDIRLVWTVDGWHTVNEFTVGAAGLPNRWHYLNAEGYPAEYEDWGLDLDIPGPVSRFEYAIVYRHGVGDRVVYEFWDNNGGSNYVVEAPAPIVAE